MADTMKDEKPRRNRRTAYLEPEVDAWIRHRVADKKAAGEKEDISDVINLAVRKLMEHKE